MGKNDKNNDNNNSKQLPNEGKSITATTTPLVVTTMSSATLTQPSAKAKPSTATKTAVPTTPKLMANEARGLDAPANTSPSNIVLAKLPSYNSEKVNKCLTETILDNEPDPVTDRSKKLPDQVTMESPEPLEEKIVRLMRSTAQQFFSEWAAQQKVALANSSMTSSAMSSTAMVSPAITSETPATNDEGVRKKCRDDVPSFLLTKNWPKFSGNHHELQGWLIAVETTFDALHISEDQFRLLVPLHNLEGDARTWFISNLTSKSKFTTWDAFKKGIMERYQIFNEQEMLREKLERLHQATTISEYSQRFRAIHNNIENMSTEDAKFRFKRGLKSEVLAELSSLLVTNKADTLEQLMSLSIIAESTANSRKGAASRDGPPSGFGKRIAAVHATGHEKRTKTFTSQMPLDGLDLPALTNNQLRDLGVCFNCLQRGHLRTECTNATVPRRPTAKPAARPAQKKALGH